MTDEDKRFCPYCATSKVLDVLVKETPNDVGAAMAVLASVRMQIIAYGAKSKEDALRMFDRIMANDIALRDSADKFFANRFDEVTE